MWQTIGNRQVSLWQKISCNGSRLICVGPCLIPSVSMGGLHIIKEMDHVCGFIWKCASTMTIDSQGTAMVSPKSKSSRMHGLSRSVVQKVVQSDEIPHTLDKGLWLPHWLCIKGGKIFGRWVPLACAVELSWLSSPREAYDSGPNLSVMHMLKHECHSLHNWCAVTGKWT